MNDIAHRPIRCPSGHEYPAALGQCVQCLTSSRPAASVVAASLASAAASLLVEAQLAGESISHRDAIVGAMGLYAEVLERMGVRLEPEIDAPRRAGSTSGSRSAVSLFDVLLNDPSEIVGRVLAGEYRVDALLGTGGTGIVFRATRLKTDERVAIKVLRGVRGRDEIWKRLVTEARAARSFVHPGFSRLEDAVEADGLRFMVLELVSGQTLRQILLQHGRLSLPVAMRIIGDVAESVGAAHDAGLLHAGLKPENIMLEARTDAPSRGNDDSRYLEGRVRVLDLGMSALESLSLDGDLEGVVSSPLYRAPEQLQRRKLDARVDVYALGLVAYECITGSNAFVDPDDATLNDVAARKLAGEAERLSKHVPVPRALEDLVAASLSRSREGRPASMSALLALLREVEMPGASNAVRSGFPGA